MLLLSVCDHATLLAERMNLIHTHCRLCSCTVPFPPAGETKLQKKGTLLKQVHLQQSAVCRSHALLPLTPTCLQPPQPQRDHLSGWRQRYFVLDGKTLYVYLWLCTVFAPCGLAHARSCLCQLLLQACQRSCASWQSLLDSSMAAARAGAACSGPPDLTGCAPFIHRAAKSWSGLRGSSPRELAASTRS